MPPHLPRPSSLRGVLTTTPLTSTTTWATSAPRLRPPSTRRSVVTIPPESPHYIQIPKPKQSDGTVLPRVRGHLPVPREIFPKRNGEFMTTPEYINQVMPLSAAEAAGRKPRSAEERRHRADVSSRRTALAKGLRGLWARKKWAEGRARYLSKQKGAENRRAALAPDAQDDVLTRGTVRLSTAAVTAVVADPERFEKAEAARARHAGIVAAKVEARRDALAQLYVAASEFIVDEEELAERVNRLFDSPHGQAQKAHEEQNIWSLHGIPISVSETRRSVAEPGMGGATSTRTTFRQKKVAEELTGGKL